MSLADVFLLPTITHHLCSLEIPNNRAYLGYQLKCGNKASITAVLTNIIYVVAFPLKQFSSFLVFLNWSLKKKICTDCSEGFSYLDLTNIKGTILFLSERFFCWAFHEGTYLFGLGSWALVSFSFTFLDTCMLYMREYKRFSSSKWPKGSLNKTGR